MTNREWLNSLSDEELAKVLSKIPREYFALADEGRCYICALADSPDKICHNPNHCEQCEAEYAEWLDSKEKKIAELAGQLDCGDIPGDYDKCKLVDSIAEQVINLGYRKADEVRKETVREVISWILNHIDVYAYFDQIMNFFAEKYDNDGVKVVEDERK